MTSSTGPRWSGRSSPWRPSSGSSSPWPVAVTTASYVTILEGNLPAARAELQQVVAVAPDVALAGHPTPQAWLAWVESRLGVAGARSRLDSLRELRMKQVAQGSLSATVGSDLVVIASALGDEAEELRWFLETTRVDEAGASLVFRDSPVLDLIRHRPEFQAVLQEAEARQAAQQRQLKALGEWTPEAALGTAGG